MGAMPGSLMRLLDAVTRSGIPSTLVVNGRGTVSVYPRQNCYVTDVQDWDNVDAEHGEGIRVMPSTWDAPPGDAQPLEELQWRLAYQDARREDDSDAHALLHLQSWPNLTRLPEELIEPATRICALLWRKPTVAFLLPRLLDLPADLVRSVLCALQTFGHVNRPPAPSSQAARPVAPTAPEPPSRGAAPTIATRFLQRLLRLPGA